MICSSSQNYKRNILLWLEHCVVKLCQVYSFRRSTSQVVRQSSHNIACPAPLVSTSLQGCSFCLTCSHPELTEDHVLTRNAINKSVWRKKDCFWLPLNKYAMNIWISSLKIRAHLSWRTGKYLHVLHVLRTYSMCSYPGYQDTTTYAALINS